MDRKLSRRDLLSLGAVVGIGWAAATLFQRAAPIGRDVSANRTAQALLADNTSPGRDPGNADLTMVVFTDYRCPSCKLASPAMEAAVRRDGRVRVIYRDWPILGPQSDRAARVAVASARQAIYLQVHERLMAERRQLGDDVLRAVVEAAGGDWSRIIADMADEDIDAKIARNGADAFALSLPGTPGYLVGTRLVVGGLDEAGFTSAFAEAREHRA